MQVTPAPAKTIAFEVEISEDLYDSFQNYLKVRPDWDQSRCLNAALSLFLMQNREDNDPTLSRVYLDSLFNRKLATLQSKNKV